MFSLYNSGNTSSEFEFCKLPTFTLIYARDDLERRKSLEQKMLTLFDRRFRTNRFIFNFRQCH